MFRHVTHPTLEGAAAVTVSFVALVLGHPGESIAITLALAIAIISIFSLNAYRALIHKVRVGKVSLLITTFALNFFAN